jgi:hypothetical protein
MGKRNTVVKIIERVEGRYEVQDVEFGKVYKWRPESVVIECDCEQRFTTEGNMVASSCPRCGAEHTAGVARELEGKPLLAEEEAYRCVRREYEAWTKDQGNHHRKHSEGLYGAGLLSGLAAKDEMNRILNVLYGS